MGGDDKPEESTPPNPFDAPLDDIIRFNHQAPNVFLDRVRRPSFDINNPANDSPPPIFDDDTPNTYNTPSVFSPPSNSLDDKMDFIT